MNLTRISNDLIHAAIDPSGAELVELALTGRKNVLWEKDNVHWNRVAPNLFPIVGRLKNDSYSFNGLEYKMSQHGFARDRAFDVESRTATSVTFVLKSDQETREKYPFDFEFRVIYSLDNETIIITYSTRNLGDEVMPYSVGGHPGFSISAISDHTLEFPGKIETERHVLNGSQFSGDTEPLIIDQKLELNNDLFMRDAIVLIQPSFSTITLSNNKSGPILSMHSDNWEALGIWTKQGAPFLCIEPWWGYADREDTSGNLNEKAGIHLLSPGEKEEVNYEITLIAN